MYVSAYMSRPVVTVTPDTLLPEVEEILGRHGFRHLPVTDANRRLVGIVTDRDLRSARPAILMTIDERQGYEKRFAAMPVSAIMTEAVARLGDTATLDDALLLFDRTRVGALPVVDDEARVVGILAIGNLLTAYRKLFGLGERGSALIAVADDAGPHPFSRLARALEEHDIPFSRLIKGGTADRRGGGGLLYVRVHTHNLSSVHAVLTESGFTSVIPLNSGGERRNGPPDA